MASTSVDETARAPGGAASSEANTNSDTRPGSVEDGEVTGGSECLGASTPVDADSANKGEDVRTGDDELQTEGHNGAGRSVSQEVSTDAPPLPQEDIPPLPAEAPPGAAEVDDGWAPLWEETAQAFYFYNRFTGATQWHNPRVPEAPLPPGVEASTAATQEAPPAGRPAGGYDPAIHGDYDETAWYAQPLVESEQPPLPVAGAAPDVDYGATATFNRFTGRYQAADLTAENFNDENKSKRQMNAFFDVDLAANSHDGRSLKEERSGKKLSKQELKQFKEKRKAKKEEKRRAWLRD